jgi:hypothetical protein
MFKSRKELIDMRKYRYNKHAWRIGVGYKYITMNDYTYKTIKELEDQLWRTDYEKVIDIAYGLMYYTYFDGIHKKRDIIYDIIYQVRKLNIYEPTHKERIEYFLSINQ